MAKQDSGLMNLANPVTGANVLALAVQVEQTKAFQKLLALGANPNFINPYTKHSILMDAIKPFGSQLEWRKEPQYVELLLGHGAGPNYAIEDPFTNDKKEYIMATSPLMRAARLDLNVLKLLIKRGADPHRKLGKRQLA
ncbi:MAG: ankyrin repeat domain-containing protein [Bacteroidota bacterium]